MAKKLYYFDNAATTSLGAEPLAAMLPYLTQEYGNASSIYSIGRSARQAVEESRQSIAAAIGGRPEEIYFTSGGTEADNWALRGVAERFSGKKNKLITSTIEHHAILHTTEKLAKQGYEIGYLPVNHLGLTDPAQLAELVDESTCLVSVMMANNEIGTIQPIKELAEVAHKAGALFHTDAVQTVGHIPLNVKELGVDLLSLSGHKFHGPKGVGALYIRKGVILPNLIHGGAQERNKRAGTENVAGIVGMAKALEIAVAKLAQTAPQITALRDKLINTVLETIPFTRLNGDRVHRLPGNVNISIESIEGEALLLKLDHQGIAASSGSACTSGSLDPSHVLLAIGLPHEIAHGSLRLTLSEHTTEEEVAYVIKTLPGIVEELRAMSPLWDEKCNKQ
jgi:cysteine desulfurase